MTGRRNLLSGQPRSLPASGVGRRTIIGAGAILAAASVISRLAAVGEPPPPRETGLASEGLLAGEAGFQPRRPAPLPLSVIPGFLSAAQLAMNHSAYREAFNALVAAENALRSASRAGAHADDYRRLRARQLAAGNAVLMHEFYFRNLALAPVRPPSYVVANMAEHMGSFESWSADFRACAQVARSWAVLVYDPYDDRWHNAALGEDDAGGWVGSNPLVVCDVAEHAWSIDYRDRETYVGRFLEHIDWRAVSARYRAADRH